MEIERRALTDDCELRLEDGGRRLSGVALRFNVQAADRAERFAPGAFDLAGADVILGSGASGARASDLRERAAV